MGRINHDNSIFEAISGTEVIFSCIKIVVTLAAAMAIGMGLLMYKNEILTIKNLVSALLVILVIAITTWRIRAESKKERQERRYANKVLADNGLEPLKE